MRRRSAASILTITALGFGLWFTYQAQDPAVPASGEPVAKRAVAASQGAHSRNAGHPAPASRSGPEELQAVSISSEQVSELAFEHEFLEIGERLEVAVEEASDGTYLRRMLARSPQYPDRIYIEERFAATGEGFEPVQQLVEVADEWIVQVEGGDTATVRSLESTHGAEVVRRIEEIGHWTLRFPESDLRSRSRLRESLQAEEGVHVVYENGVIWPAKVPNDPGYGGQWELHKIQPELGWDYVTDAAINDRVNVIAAVIDTGVNFKNPDILPWVNQGEIPGNGIDDDGNGYIDDVHGYDAFSMNGDVQRNSGHGVNVANILGSRTNNGIGKASVAWSVEVMAGISFSRSGAGSTSAASNAIHYAGKQGARVVNASFIGGGASSYTYIIRQAALNNMIIVAGAGNSGWDITKNPTFPINVDADNIIGVGATTQNDKRAGYSNYSKDHVDVFAPNTGGTSYATPYVTSLVALLIGDDPDASYPVIIDRVMAGVDPVDSLKSISVSGGRINVTKSLRLNDLRRPKDLRATRLSNGSTRLVWTDQSTAETGFIVERSSKDPASVRNPDDPAQMSWQVIANNIPANRTWYDDDSANGKTWYYRVRAKGKDRNSSRNFETRVIAKSGSAPSTAAPSNPVKSLYANGAGTDRVSLSWTDSSNNEAGYVLERSEDGGHSYYILAWLPANSSSYVDRDVSAGQQLSYRLKTYTIASGSYSSATALVVGEASRVVELVAPANLKAQNVNQSSNRLSWVDRSEGESGYQVERSTSSGSGFSVVARLGANVQSYSDSGLKASTTYYYRVSALDGDRAVSSGVVSAKTPAPPANLVAPSVKVSVESHSAVKISWQDQSSGETGYLVERAANSSGPFTKVATLAPNSTSYRNTGLSAGTRYFFRVTVTDGSTSRSSSAVSVTTPNQPAALEKPVPQAARTTESMISISWSDASERHSGYRVEYSTQSSSGPFVLAGSLSAKTKDFDLTDLDPSTRHYIRVGVQDGSQTVYSSVLTATTKEAAPGIQAPEVQATVLGDGRVRVSWNSTAPADVRFVVERSNSPDGSYGEIAVLNGSARQYIDSSLTAGRTAYYRVRIEDGAETGSAYYRYFRWVVTERRAAANSIQVSEFELTRDGKRISELATASVSNPGGNSPNKEKVNLGVDAKLGTKWLDFKFDGSTSTEIKNTRKGQSVLALTFPAAVEVTGYRWSTANDWLERDPAGWRLEASSDGEAWITLHEVEGFTAPAARRVVAGNWDLVSGVSSLVSESVEVSVGGGKLAWRKEHFGTESGDGMAADDADPDGDGWSNLVEYATLMSPVDAQGSVSEPGRSADGRLTLSFERRWEPDVSYIVQATGDLSKGVWSDIAELRAGSTGWKSLQSGVKIVESGSGESRSVTVTDHQPSDGKQRYLRLVIENK